MSTRNIPGGEGQPACKADNLTAICEPIVYKMWEPQHLTALWVSTAHYRDTFTYLTVQKRAAHLPDHISEATQTKLNSDARNKGLDQGRRGRKERAEEGTV
jgi:hypothetical protein